MLLNQIAKEGKWKMGIINQAKDLIKAVNQIDERLYICNDIIDKLDRSVTISIADRYMKPTGYLYAEASDAIRAIAIRHIEKLACELDELDRQDITCDPVKKGW